MNRSRWAGWAQYRGLFSAVREGNGLARALAVMDSRAFVRALFLSSAVTSGILEHLADGLTRGELARRTISSRPDRLQAWLDLGVDLGELRLSGGQYRVKGTRARALSQGDKLLKAHYRSMLEYQAWPYSEFTSLLRDAPGEGRDDLGRFAAEIAQVSLAAAPFIAALLRRVLAELHPDLVLDVGCGTGFYTKAVLESGPAVCVEGVDLAEPALKMAQDSTARAGFGRRARFHHGDVREWLEAGEHRYDLVLLLNNVYYMDRSERRSLYGLVAASLNDGGEVLLATMTSPGSVAASHLNLMLVCQAGAASLPGPAELASDLTSAQLEVIDEQQLVPGEPFVGLRARRSAGRHE
jgi:SAM-dependent methyltransferase